MDDKIIEENFRRETEYAHNIKILPQRIFINHKGKERSFTAGKTDSTETQCLKLSSPGMRWSDVTCLLRGCTEKHITSPAVLPKVRKLALIRRKPETDRMEDIHLDWSVLVWEKKNQCMDQRQIRDCSGIKDDQGEFHFLSLSFQETPQLNFLQP